MPPFRSSTINRSRKLYERSARSNGNSDDKWVHDLAPEPAATTRLVVSNLHWEVTEDELTSIFGAIGTLANKPVIRYDRSGRSTGVATVDYMNQTDATRAKNQLDGKIAKTQAISITFGPQRTPASVRKSLLNRVEKPPLLARLSEGKDAEAKIIRNRRLARGTVGKRGARSGVVGPKKDVTAADLDKELDAFMSVDVAKGDVDMS
ncbi:hypothetical protein Clacol_009217 [Clathrus columnatus]|uniref:RRM domain-containing protein n=1 Tax=Clathrus columnatus TaxID=1419009 RepID=A0AAV5AME0_9AGAM|nr:hypothetical protein Clacol_009217 [Clathrus columnatus]